MYLFKSSFSSRFCEFVPVETKVLNACIICMKTAVLKIQVSDGDKPTTFKH